MAYIDFNLVEPDVLYIYIYIYNMEPRRPIFRETISITITTNITILRVMQQNMAHLNFNLGKPDVLYIYNMEPERQILI